MCGVSIAYIRGGAWLDWRAVWRRLPLRYQLESLGKCCVWVGSFYGYLIFVCVLLYVVCQLFHVFCGAFGGGSYLLKGLE